MTKGKIGLLLAGLAGYAYYKYSKMSPEEKENMLGSWKEKATKFVDGLPGGLKNIFGNSSTTAQEQHGSFKAGF